MRFTEWIKIKSEDHQLDHDLEESLCNPFSPFKEFLLMKIFEVQLLFLLLHSRSKSLICFLLCKVNYCWTNMSIWKEVAIINICTILPEVLKIVDANTTRFPTEVSTWANALPDPRAIAWMKLHPNFNFWSANTHLYCWYCCCCIATAFALLLLYCCWWSFIAAAIGKRIRRGKRPEKIEETRGREERIRQRISSDFIHHHCFTKE